MPDFVSVGPLSQIPWRSHLCNELTIYPTFDIVVLLDQNINYQSDFVH
jgi:hypothetical protein